MTEAPLEHLSIHEPAMLGFMRSLPIEGGDIADLALWEQENAFREQVSVPISRFVSWLEGISPDFEARRSLQESQLGRTTAIKKGDHISLHHVPTGLVATGHDETEATHRLADAVTTQLTRWLEEGSLLQQAKKYSDQLTFELAQTFYTPEEIFV